MCISLEQFLCVFTGAFVAFHQFTPATPQITTDNWKENGNRPYYQLADTHVELKYSIKDNKKRYQRRMIV